MPADVFVQQATESVHWSPLSYYTYATDEGKQSRTHYKSRGKASSDFGRPGAVSHRGHLRDSHPLRWDVEMRASRVSQQHHPLRVRT